MTSQLLKTLSLLLCLSLVSAEQSRVSGGIFLGILGLVVTIIFIGCCLACTLALCRVCATANSDDVSSISSIQQTTNLSRTHQRNDCTEQWVSSGGGGYSVYRITPVSRGLIFDDLGSPSDPRINQDSQCAISTRCSGLVIPPPEYSANAAQPIPTLPNSNSSSPSVPSNLRPPAYSSRDRDVNISVEKAPPSYAESVHPKNLSHSR